MYGHRSRGCLQKRTCKVCNGHHPTGLHQDNFQMQRQTKKSNDNKTDDRVKNAAIKITTSDVIRDKSPKNNFVELIPIVPVMLKSDDAGVKTYAMLDNCSTGTLILEISCKSSKQKV